MVITFALHAKGPRFETGRKQVALLHNPIAEISDWWNHLVLTRTGSVMSYSFQPHEL